MTDSLPRPPEGTNAALLEAGLKLFGKHGFSGTSTREIAALAGTNVASIAYHFGGKDGLHTACAAEVARRLSAVAPLSAPPDITPDQARAFLETALRALAGFLLTSPAAADVAAFILRVLGSGSGEAIDTLYASVIETKHRELCRLWALATGQDPESETTRLAVFAAIGQLVYFRIGLPVVTRRMGWDRIGPAEAGAIADIVAANLHAALERSRVP